MLRVEIRVQLIWTAGQFDLKVPSTGHIFRTMKIKNIIIVPIDNYTYSILMSAILLIIRVIQCIIHTGHIQSN